MSQRVTAESNQGRLSDASRRLCSQRLVAGKTDVCAKNAVSPKHHVWSEVADKLTKNNTEAGMSCLVLVRDGGKKMEEKSSLLAAQNLCEKRANFVHTWLACKAVFTHSLPSLTLSDYLCTLYSTPIPFLIPYTFFFFLLLPETTEDSACNITPAYPKGSVAWENI